MLTFGGGGRVNFAAASFFSGARGRIKMSLPMTQSERIRLIQEQANKFVSRNKCNDSSLQTLIVQAKASATYTPQRVQGNNGCTVVATGKGTNGEFINILQAAQANAMGAPCSNTPGDTGVTRVVTVPTPCINYNAPPWTQQNMSSFYTAPCAIPGKNDYFPPRVPNGPGCTTTKITTPSG
jgi:hypothetical protein